MRGRPFSPGSFLISLVTVVLLWSGQPLSAQVCPGLDAAHEDFGGLNTAPRAVKVVGNLAYTAGVYGLAVYDVGNPRSPVKIGELGLPEEAYGIDVADGVAWVADGFGGLRSVDVSDPEHPEELGSYATENLAFEVVVDGTLVYVADRYAGVLILDASDPAHPELLGGFDPPSAMGACAVSGRYAYLLDGTATFRVVDLSDPTSPVEVGALGGLRTSGWSLTVGGGVAWLWDGMLRAIDVSDPRTPRLVSTTSPGGIAYDLEVRDDRLYLASWASGLRIMDVSDPAAPVLLGSDQSHRYARGVDVLGTTAYVAWDWEGFSVVDVSDGTDPAALGWAGSEGQARDVVVAGDHALVADGLAGLLIVDVSDPDHTSVVGRYEAIDNALAVEVSGSRAYVGGLLGDLYVLDISGPSNPVLLGTIRLSGAVEDIAVSGSTVLAASGGMGLHVVDVSDPGDPRLLTTLHTPGAAYGVAVKGSLAYVADWMEGLMVVDLADPRNPREIGRCDTRWLAVKVDVEGDHAYVADKNGGLQVIDIADPVHPRPAGVLAGEIWNLEVVGKVAYCLVDHVRLRSLAIVDVTDPWNPALVRSIPTRRIPWAVAVDRTTRTAWMPTSIFLEGVDLGCATCAGLEVVASPREIPPGGDTSTITVTVRDLVGNPMPGQAVSGTAADGSLTAFTDLGDGTYRATFTSGSRLGWVPLEITVNGAACFERTPVHVVASSAPPITELDGSLELSMIPAAAHASGQEGTNWRTDVVLHNPGTRDASVVLYFLAKGRDNSDAVGHRVTVERQASLVLDDVVAGLFGLESGAGAILVASDEPLQVTSRTYNDVPGGTYGQFIPGSPVLRALERGEEARLIQLIRTEDYRTNIGFANASGSTITVQVELYDAEGTPLGSRSFGVPAWGYYQKTDIFGGGADVEDAYAVVRSQTPGARFFTYASVVDEHSGDPVLILPVEASSGTPLYVPAAAHVGGAAGTNWRTDLEVHNPGTTTASFTVELLERDSANTSPESASFTLGPGRSLRLADVLHGVFGFSGAAALRIRPSSGTIMATSRTYNDVPGGTYGQFIPAVPRPGGEPWGYRSRLIQLAGSPSDAHGFRTNIGLLEVGGSTSDITVGLYTAEGVRLGEIKVTLRPSEYVQLNRVFRQVGAGSVEGGYAILNSRYYYRKVLAYASVVDNVSGDPVYLPAEEVE